MKQQIAVYTRLSQEDVDKRTNAIKDVSNSIASQRALIHRHLDQMPTLCDLSRIEFSDDGFSGTNFDRPDFARMIEMTKSGEISCIVVKDLSRFGRDYLEVGDYLEHIFPFLGIRFMSINDHYDSEFHKGQTIGMDVAFKNLIYDYYCKDLSKKVKSAMGIKQRECCFVTCPPYGYRVLAEEKHRLVIDPEAALIVRRIFLDVIAGKSCTEIAKELNTEGIPTPSQHKGIKRRSEAVQPQWTHRTILLLIENIKYTGTMVNHTRESRHIRDLNQRRVPKEEWYVKENAHEGIVTTEEYEAAQAAIRRKRTVPRKQHDQSDRVYYCGHCGGKLEKANGTVFACPSHRYHSSSDCEAVHVTKASIEQILLEALRHQVQISRVERKRIQQDKDQIHQLVRQQTILTAQLEASGREKFSLYERYREGELTRNVYLEEKDNLTRRQVQMQEQLHKCQEALGARQHAFEKVSDKQKSLGGMEELTEEQLRSHLYDAVERVVIWDENSIEIVWKFDQPDKTA